jgi:hypothetical protein
VTSTRPILVACLIAGFLLSGCQSFHSTLRGEDVQSPAGTENPAWVKYEWWQEYPVLATSVLVATGVGLCAMRVLCGFAQAHG